MRILYVASDQTLPGETGGSVHVHEVSRELAKRGHEVHAVVRDLGEKSPGDGYTIHRIRWTPVNRWVRPSTSLRTSEERTLRYLRINPPL